MSLNYTKARRRKINRKLARGSLNGLDYQNKTTPGKRIYMPARAIYIFVSKKLVTIFDGSTYHTVPVKKGTTVKSGESLRKQVVWKLKRAKQKARRKLKQEKTRQRALKKTLRLA